MGFYRLLFFEFGSKRKMADVFLILSISSFICLYSILGNVFGKLNVIGLILLFKTSLYVARNFSYSLSLKSDSESMNFHWHCSSKN